VLSRDIIKKIKKIHIRSRRRVNTMMAGQYRSVFRGSGMEFEEVREYTSGDEVKNIDWKVSARMGRPFVKLFKEEREMVVMLMVDISGSGLFGTTGRTKRETAAEIASIIAFNAIRNNDKVGLILFSDRVEKYIPPRKGSSQIWQVIKEIYTFTPRHSGTCIREAVSFLSRVTKKRTVSFLISDFLDSGFEKQMLIASKRHELIAVFLSDPNDFHLPPAGIFMACDLETGRMIHLDASDHNTRQAYSRLMKKEHEKTLDVITRAGIDCIELATDASVADVLVRYFRTRERQVRL